jgi:hypothetical protein
MAWPHSAQGTKHTPDGEMWVTSTERETDVFSQYSENAIAATKYIILVDKDNAAFPHKIQNQPHSRIDVTSLYVALDAAVNTNGIFSIGVISRIDGTNADIWYMLGIPFLATTNQFVVSLRGVPSQVKLDLVGGVLQHGITNNRETDVAAVNTATLLDSPLGASTVTPAVGDVIAKLTHSAGGSFNIGMFIFYHGH